MANLLTQAHKKVSHKLFLTSKSLLQNAIFLGNRAQKPNLHVFVAGAQRSGTNMMMDVLERSLQTDIYHETDTRAFDNYLMRDVCVIRALVEESKAPIFVIKALCELDRLTELMTSFEPAKTVWIVRDFNDVVNSALISFKSLPRSVADMVIYRDQEDWRSRGMSDATFGLLRELYHAEIDAASAIALFWYSRNILFFEQHLDQDSNVLLVRYESLVSEPERSFERIFKFLELNYSLRIVSNVFNSSIGRRPPPVIESAVREVCEELLHTFQLTIDTDDRF